MGANLIEDETMDLLLTHAPKNKSINTCAKKEIKNDYMLIHYVCKCINLRTQNIFITTPGHHQIQESQQTTIRVACRKQTIHRPVQLKIKSDVLI